MQKLIALSVPTATLNDIYISLSDVVLLTVVTTVWSNIEIKNMQLNLKLFSIFNVKKKAYLVYL